MYLASVYPGLEFAVDVVRPHDCAFGLCACSLIGVAPVGCFPALSPNLLTPDRVPQGWTCPVHDRASDLACRLGTHLVGRAGILPPRPVTCASL